jgi:hypothetical protein
VYEVIPAAKSFAKTNKKVLGLCQNRPAMIAMAWWFWMVLAGCLAIFFLVYDHPLSWPSCILLVVLLMTSSAQPKIMATDVGSPISS